MAKPPSRISFAKLQHYLNTNPRKAAEYFIVVEGDSPFSVQYIPDPDRVELPGDLNTLDDIRARGSFIIAIGNIEGRRRRRDKFKKLINHDLDGYLAAAPENFTLVAEGDSWFHYPVIEPDDPIEILLARKMPIWTIAGAAAQLKPMVNIPTYRMALSEYKASVLLFSGGGNDMLGNGDLDNRMNRYVNGMQPAEMLNKRFDEGIDEAIALYQKLFDDMKARFPKVWTIVHGYDYAVPMEDKKKGKWLYPTLKKMGCPNKQFMWDVTKEMVNRYNAKLNVLAANANYDRVRYVDFRNTIAPQNATYSQAVALWHDEIHARSAGFRKVATRLKREINNLPDKVATS